MPDILKIAHRGFSEKFPENTMLAFEKAIEAGAHMIELDVHLAKDGVPVIIHDDDIDRTSNGSGMVKDFTLNELRAYDFNNGNTEFGIQVLPELDEVIDLVKGRAMLNIELKNLPVSYPGIEETVFKVIKRHDFLDDVIISSFDHFSLLKFKALAPGVKIGMLYVAVWTYFFEELEKLGAYSVHPHVDAAFTDSLKHAHERGYRVFPWVVKEREKADLLRQSGYVDGLMVNDLDIL